MIAVAVLATLSILSASCSSPRGPMDVGSAAPFIDEGATQDSGYDGVEAKIEMEKRGDRWFITVYQGQQQSGGYAIQVVHAIHVGTGMRLRARFTTPAVNTVMPSIKTSPAHTISLGFGADEVALFDQDDRMRAELIRR